MSQAVQYFINRASETEIAEHLIRCDADFLPALSNRVDINDYAEKIAGHAIRFEAWGADTIVGLVALYCNDQEQRIAHITSVSVLREWRGKGVASCLVGRCIEHAKILGMKQIGLEVASSSISAIKLYEKCGFASGRTHAPFVDMNLNLRNAGRT